MTTYWTEEIDSLYKIYFGFMQYLYQQHSGEFVSPGDPNFMSVKELRWIAVHYGLQNDLCSEKNVNYSFNMSKESQVDEISTEQLL